MSIVDIVST